ncbi:MAG TPA: hypothetical protein VIS05_10770 [Ilumatobacter sp.]
MPANVEKRTGTLPPGDAATGAPSGALPGALDDGRPAADIDGTVRS